jgi:hypothetical protein
MNKGNEKWKRPFLNQKEQTMDMFKKNHSSSANTFLTYQRDLAIREEIEDLKIKIEYLEGVRKGLKEPKEDPQGSVKQIAFALYYLQEAKIIQRNSVNKSRNAKFISFLTGKSSESIRKDFDDPKRVSRKEKSGKATQELINDLLKIRHQFDILSFFQGKEMIDKDIEALQKDLKSFNQ